MSITCFLSIDEDQPLALWWADSKVCGVVPLSDFLKLSKIDMSKEQAARYIPALQEFVNELKEWANV